MISLYTESRLAGILQQNLTSSQETIQVLFLDKRIPKKQRLRLTLNLGKANQEEVLFSSHTTDEAGITTLAIEKRNLIKTGNIQDTENFENTGNTGFFHSQNSHIASVDNHWTGNVLERLIEGEEDSLGFAGINLFSDNEYSFIRFGEKEGETNAVFRVEKATGIIAYKQADEEWQALSDREGVSANNGVILEDGNLRMNIKENSPLVILDNKLKINTAKNIIEANAITGKTVLALNENNKIDSSLLTEFLSDEAFSVSWQSLLNKEKAVNKYILGFLFSDVFSKIEKKVKSFSSKILKKQINTEYLAPRDTFISISSYSMLGGDIALRMNNEIMQEITVGVQKKCSLSQLVPKGANWKIETNLGNDEITIKSMHREA